MAKTSIQIRKELALMSLDNIYQRSCSTTEKVCDSDKDIYYSEVMARYLLGKRNELLEIIRQNSWKIVPSEGLNYFSDYRTNITKSTLDDNGKPHFKEGAEKPICKDMYIKSKNGTVYDGIGTIIDFETPLAHLKGADKGQYQSRKVGNVDMISCSFENEPTIWLLEVKNESSDESMYRCVMEGFTYLQTIDRARFLENLNEHTSQFGVIPNNIKFRTAPLIAYKKKQFEEMKEAKEKPQLHKNLLELMQLLDVTEYFSYEKSAGQYNIRKHSIY